MEHNILLSITTTKDSDWRGKIEETKRFGIEEVALFPTCLNPEQRKELYSLLEQSPINSIPHVHIRNDMEAWELTFLTEKYKTKIFNTHPTVLLPFTHDISQFYDSIYIENVGKDLDDSDLSGFAGLCIDFSHWESFNLSNTDGDKPEPDPILWLIEKYPIGCCHISAINEDNIVEPEGRDRHRYSFHMMKNVNELNYMKKYLCLLPTILSLELSNCLAEQLEAKEYLEKMLN